MKCDQFEQRVQDLLDQRFDPGSDTLLRMHADRCHDCRSLLRGFESVVALERRALTVQAAVRPGTDQASWALSTRCAAAAVVAALCIGAILVAARLSSMQLNSATSRVVVAVAAGDPLNTNDDHRSVSSAPNPAHTASALAGENDVQRLRDLVAPLADAAGVAAATGGASLAPQAPLAPSVATVARPLAKPFAAAWNVFRRALSPAHDNEQPRPTDKPQAQLCDPVGLVA